MGPTKGRGSGACRADGRSAKRTTAVDPDAAPAPSTSRRTPDNKGQAVWFSRWDELTDNASAWWMRSAGLGVRMRLDELSQLAEAHQSGSVAKEAIKRLRDEARVELCGPGSYLTASHPTVSTTIRKAIAKDEVEAFIPGSMSTAAIDASRQMLGETDYIGDLSRSLCAATTLSPSLDQVRELVSLVDLFDAELAYEGHSPAWRRDLAQRVQQSISNGSVPDVAIEEGLTHLRFGHRRTFEVLVPLARYGAPEAGGSLRTALDPDAALELLRDWGDAAAIKAVAEVPAFVRYDVESVDPGGAAQQADQRFRLDAGLFRLQTGTADDQGECLVFDRSQAKVSVVSFPPERIRPLPAGADIYDERGLVDDRIAAALTQLAQARMGDPSSALADLWTATEIVFGGPIGDLRHEAGGSLAELSQYLFPTAILDWLGERSAAAGIELVGSPRHIALRDALEQDFGKVSAALVRAGDVLAHARLKGVSKWDIGSGFDRELSRIRAHSLSLADRAFLIRNFLLHSGGRNLVAVTVTLSAFAPLVSACFDHLLTYRPRFPITHAKLGYLRSDLVARRFAAGSSKGPAGLGPLLQSADDPTAAATRSGTPQMPNVTRRQPASPTDATASGPSVDRSEGEGTASPRRTATKSHTLDSAS